MLVTSCGTNIPEELAEVSEDLPETVDFNYHIKPILSDRCYTCHGPDENSRKAGFRLDADSYAFNRLRSGKFAIVGGNPGKSELVRRILSEDDEIIMPPPESHLSLNNREKALLIKWIEQGAEWKKHWAFLPPQPGEITDALPDSWKRNNPIDHFIQDKLKQAGVAPAPEADKERLLRRVTIDLTGLPPSIDEIDAFLGDHSEDAYEKVVDRLLVSDAHAERLALDWMDLSRYADSHGLHADGWRLMWPWRDWVINAFLENVN